MNLEKPLFMTNSEWYYFDDIEWKYKLTDNATEDAKKSYGDYYSSLGQLERR